MADGVLYPDEIRELSTQEIVDSIDDAYDQLLRLRFQKATGELKDANLVRQSKRNLARLKTILHERQQELAEE